MSVPAPADSLIGTTLDRYRIVSALGKGGMGVVYAAEHTQLGKRVAIKLILEKYANDSDAIERFRREALAASRIGNPHIVGVADIGTAPDGRTFVVMELLDGQPLSKIIEAGPLPPHRAIAIMRQVLRAVAAAHAKGIVHRDLKPDNIFLVANAGIDGDARDFVKLLDFGVSKIIDSEAAAAPPKLTVTGMVIGTPLYMAPEQALGGDIDHRADIYACGVILYEMLAGQPPFDGATYAVLVAKLLTQDPPHLAQVRSGLPVTLVENVHRALAKDPDARFQTADDFAHVLAGGRVSSGPVVAVAAVSQTHRPRRWTWLVGVVVVAAAAGIPIAVMATRSSPDIAKADVPTTRPPVATGTLEIKSTPSGARVAIDDSPAGSSPVVVTLSAGSHRVHVEADGRVAVDAEQDVRAGERTSIVLPLVERAPDKVVEQPTVVAPPPTPAVRTQTPPATTRTVTTPKPQTRPPVAETGKPNPY